MVPARSGILQIRPESRKVLQNANSTANVRSNLSEKTVCASCCCIGLEIQIQLLVLGHSYANRLRFQEGVKSALKIISYSIIGKVFEADFLKSCLSRLSYGLLKDLRGFRYGLTWLGVDI